MVTRGGGAVRDISKDGKASETTELGCSHGSWELCDDQAVGFAAALGWGVAKARVLIRPCNISSVMRGRWWTVLGTRGGLGGCSSEVVAGWVVCPKTCFLRLRPAESLLPCCITVVACCNGGLLHTGSLL